MDLADYYTVTWAHVDSGDKLDDQPHHLQVVAFWKLVGLWAFEDWGLLLHDLADQMNLLFLEVLGGVVHADSLVSWGLTYLIEPLGPEV